MTTPGSRQAQQTYQQQVQNNSATFRRNAAHADHLRYRRRGRVGVVRRLFGLMFSLVFLAIVAAIFVVVLSAAQPDWFDNVQAWFDQIF
ncbi:hypothetical protein [Actinophytocola sp.]|uniref:hypothetical protein n=1 Tax=Actinophytocola sp. TaxID=1872138 RepID=UPI002ED5363F